MTDKYYQKYNESFKKKHVKDMKIFLENKKAKGKKGQEKYIKILLKTSVLLGT